MRVSPQRASGIIRNTNNNNNNNNTTGSPIVDTTYVSSDFGENAINNHTQGVSWHSNKNQIIFNYITRNFRDRCTSYESYLTPELNNTYVGDELHACKLMKADIIYTPYVNSAVTSNTNNNNFILSVGSHYDNDGQSDQQIGTDNNRHDITSGPDVFLSDSIAVSARTDTPELFKDYTSEGYGMEFFEDCSPAYLDVEYPDKDIPSAFAALLSDDGLIFTSTQNPGFTQYLTVGDEIEIRNYSTGFETGIIKTINGPSSITLESAISPISTTDIYGWHNVNLSSYIAANQESWAVPLVAGKLKVIKMTTGANWDTVRAAARATARRNPTGVPEIDNTNWDMWRGFGCIHVNDAISYINNNLE